MTLWAPPFPPESATVQVEFGAQSRRGSVRAVNEDHYVVMRLGRNQETILTSLPETAVARQFEEHGYAMMVADGMGGTGAGERASRRALAILVQLVLYFGKWNLRVDDMIAHEIMARAERFYRHVDAAMTSAHDPEGGESLQTTLTAVFGAGRDLFFAHVGHSRAYLMRHTLLLRLTRDHTIETRQKSHAAVAPLMDVNATARDLKHVLTETLGMGRARGALIDLERFQLDDGDVVLVCTNGLTDVVSEEEIRDVLMSGRPPAEMSALLIDRAASAGAEDDATALVARYRLQPPPAS
jgi:protein phosphatase